MQLNTKDYDRIQAVLIKELALRGIKFSSLKNRDFEMITIGINSVLKIQKGEK